jgi:hypothetical protein
MEAGQGLDLRDRDPLFDVGEATVKRWLHRALVRKPPTDGAVGKSLKIDGAALAQLLAGVPHEKRRSKP